MTDVLNERKLEITKWEIKFNDNCNLFNSLEKSKRIKLTD